MQPQAGISIGGGTGNSDEEVPSSFTLNGEQLKRSQRDRDFPWATKVSTRRPKDWIAWGGYGGVRVFEDIITFEPVVIDGIATTINFGGSTSADPLRINLYDTEFNYLNSAIDTGNLVQSYQLAFPPATLGVPRFWPGPNSPNANRWYSFGDRMKSAIANGPDWLYSPTRDVIHSLVPRHGDYRLVTSRRVVAPDTFVPHPDYGSSQRMAHSLTDYYSSAKNGAEGMPGAVFGRSLIPAVRYPASVTPDFPISPDDKAFTKSAETLVRGPIDPAVTGDWDTGIGPGPDGAFIGKPDEGDMRGLGDGLSPYFDSNREPRSRASVNFVPRRMALPGLMGSLPTGVQADIPWQTLLFRPDPQGTHYGATTNPQDHLWLDLFRMPIVGPFENSDAFSTDGKVNLNYRIAPFSYIHRSTALHAAFKSEKILAIPNSAAGTYKSQTTASKWRHHIDAAETLKQWEEKFESGELFRTESEICEMYLVPEGERWSLQALQDFWQRHALTGDNVKERPYANLHAMVTTKSNSFDASIIAQTINKSPDSEPDRFDPDKDKITSEWRGVGNIRRHLNPEDERLLDYAGNAARGESLEPSPQELHSIVTALTESRDPETGGIPRFEITQVDYDFTANQVTITWNSSPGESYTVEASGDAELSQWNRIDATDVDPAIPSAGRQTSFTLLVGPEPIAVRVARQ